MQLCVLEQSVQIAHIHSIQVEIDTHLSDASTDSDVNVIWAAETMEYSFEQLSRDRRRVNSLEKMKKRDPMNAARVTDCHVYIADNPMSSAQIPIRPVHTQTWAYRQR